MSCSSNEDDPAHKAFLALDMLGSAKLYEHFCTMPGLADFGSSSIGEDFADDLDIIKLAMTLYGGVHQPWADMQKVWRSLGDPSGTFYFSGLVMDAQTGKARKVDPATYMMLLSHTIHQVPEEVRRKFDTLCKSFSDSLDLVNKGEQVFFTGKHGYRVPAGVNHRLLSQEELAQYAMTEEETKEHFGWMFGS